MKVATAFFVLLATSLMQTEMFAQPTPITDWPYGYDWTGASDFALSADARTYVGGDGHWGSYAYTSYGWTYLQFSTSSGRAYTGGRGSTVGNDTLFAMVDARTRSFTGSETFYFSAARESQSVSAYGQSDNLKVYVNNTLLKSVIVKNLSYLGDSLSNYSCAIPLSVQRTIFTLSIIVEDNSQWSGARVIIDNTSFPGGPLPIALAAFNGRYEAATNRTYLTWTTLSEIANFGFEVQRKCNAGEYENIGFVPGSGTTIEPHTYSFVDSTIASPGEFRYRLVQLDLDGTRHFYDAYAITVNVSGLTTVKPVRTSSSFLLFQNYPNPCNPTTTIGYSLPHNAHVNLAVYNMLGQQVSQLVNGQQSAGYHGIVFEGKGLASGVYCYRIQSGDFVQSKKFVLSR
jgi:hypothetical protein